MHPRGGAHVHAPTPDVNGKGGDSGDKLTKSGVLNTIGKIHENVQKQLNKKKFKDCFQMNYTKIQGGLRKQMKKIDKTEVGIHKDLKQTKKGIGELQAQARRPKGGGLFGMLFGGLGGIIFTIIGGLVLITLARLALAKWKQTYMPETDGSKMTILGFQIPGWDTMKAIGLGIWNFITVGLPNYWNRFSTFIGGIKKKLFGKKGMFRDVIETKNTLRKIFFALLIANTQKIAGKGLKIVLKIIGWALCWIPGVKPVCDFLAEFAPQLYTFISTQIMLLWSNGKASAERAQKAALANVEQMTGSKSKQLKSLLMSNASGIKPFKGQLSTMSNFLQTHKGGKGKGPLARSAIMRSVPVHTNKNFDAARNVVTEDKFSKDNKEIWEGGAVDDRVKDTKNKGDILVNINNAHEQIKKHAKEYQEAWKKAKSSSWTYKGAKEKLKPSEEKFRAERKKIIYDLWAQISPQITAIDKYILQLSKSTRFQNVKGPLYDPNKGWNIGYRVLASDLMTPIPLTPFEAVHSKPDIPFGQPAAAEVDSIGFMPFKWIQKGVQQCVHPIKYELARAKAIRDIYKRYLDELCNTYKSTENADNSTAKWYTQCWTEWNYAIGKHNIGGYENENDVLFKDRFGKFLEKLRAGKIQGSDNNINTAVGQAQGWIEETAEWVSDAQKAVFKPIVKLVQNVARVFDYDKGDSSLDYKEGDSWWERRKKDAKRVARKVMTAKMLADWRAATAFGINYGDVRDFWIDSGILDLFNNNTVMGTAGAAIPLLEFLRKKGILGKAPKADRANVLHDLMWNFFNFAGIKGYTWEQVKGDEAAQAGFAQVFLEYMRYKVLPQWNDVEKLLSDDITYRTGDSHKNMVRGVGLLLKLMSSKSLFDFMYKYLRFPNMEVKLIDYSNANWVERLMLDKYRKQMGILDAEGKETLLKKLQEKWHKVINAPDEQLE